MTMINVRDITGRCWEHCFETFTLQMQETFSKKKLFNTTYMNHKIHVFELSHLYWILEN